MNTEENTKDEDRRITQEASDKYPVEFYQGIEEREQGNLDKAIECYNKAIELDPRSAEIYSQRGYAKSKLGRHEEAIKDFDKAIDLDPEDGSIYVSRGVSKGELGRREEAMEDYIKAMELDPKIAKFLLTGLPEYLDK